MRIEQTPSAVEESVLWSVAVKIEALRSELERTIHYNPNPSRLSMVAFDALEANLTSCRSICVAAMAALGEPK
jgi:hypothetical protein